MSYHAIGKENWDALPSSFSNAKLAETLEGDEEWWVYTYIFPHKFRATLNSNGFEIDIRQEQWAESDLSEYTMVDCAFDCLIKFTKSDGTFKKVLRPMEA